jgi:hypothetical protein
MRNQSRGEIARARRHDPQHHHQEFPMKMIPALALALCASAPAFASTTGFVVDFEKNWDYNNGDVNNYYSGGAAADGSSGVDLGVSFTNVSGLSNDASFTYYAGAPSMQGTAYAQTFAPEDQAFMNVAAGVDSHLSFYYSSPTAVSGAVKAYAGLNGTGALLGTFDLAANDSGTYGTWTPVTFTFTGTAQSFDLTASANMVALDNISAVPEVDSLTMSMLGASMLLALRRRRRA